VQADAFVQLLDHLGIDKVVVVGISAGAWSSLQFAVRHPDRCRALVLPLAVPLTLRLYSSPDGHPTNFAIPEKAVA
jgi:pimeloyl-ACP methyl ester carboxylesterase